MPRTPDHIKRAPRVDLRRPATLTNSEGAELNVVVLDISSGGFRLEIPDALRIGEFVTLRTEHFEDFDAQIRWVLGNEAGGVFLTPVNSSEWM
jgi:hypothetical protein